MQAPGSSLSWQLTASEQERRRSIGYQLTPQACGTWHLKQEGLVQGGERNKKSLRMFPEALLSSFRYQDQFVWPLSCELTFVSGSRR